MMRALSAFTLMQIILIYVLRHCDDKTRRSRSRLMPRVTHCALNIERRSEALWFCTLRQVKSNTLLISDHRIIPSCTGIVQDSVRLTRPFRDHGSPEIAYSQKCGRLSTKKKWVCKPKRSDTRTTKVRNPSNREKAYEKSGHGKGLPNSQHHHRV